MKPHRIILPSMMAKIIAPFLAEAEHAPGERSSVMAHFTRVLFDANAADNSHAGEVEMVLCVVPPKLSLRMRNLIVAEREKLAAKTEPKTEPQP